MGEDDAELIREMVVAAMRAPFMVDGDPLPTMSIGIAYSAPPAPNGALLDCADEALYRAKEAGRNTIRVSALDAFVTEYGALPA